MAEFTFYGKFDGSSANNSSLNIDPPGSAALEITFLPDPTAPDGGDVFLEDFGLTDTIPDPDTLVRFNGVEYSFIVEFSGTVSNTNKARNNGIANEEFTIITVDPGGANETRIVFFPNSGFTEAQVANISNGAFRSFGENTNTVIVCFAADMQVATADGPRRVDQIKAGDRVRTLPDGDLATVRWQGGFTSSAAEQAVFFSSRAVRIYHRADGRDLIVSRAHRIALSHPRLDLMFGSPTVFVPAWWLASTPFADHEPVREPVRWVHLLLDDHAILDVNGFAAESLFVGDGVKARGDTRMQGQLQIAYPGFRDPTFGADAKLAAPEMRRTEFDLLARKTPEIIAAALHGLQKVHAR
ncbi:Hint domain-containing protein [Roseobacter sp. HKCCA0434]|uniref:Hint domain-containing protein n=1 Tax=Roseobacter sp. HKCCA0434 TaxID=3079297 RepID=UPI002905E64B|nr:Hint domain-containing protein [Roseobacter sp. HKCCA0434]